MLFKTINKQQQMQDLVREAIYKDLNTKKAVKDLAKADPKYQDLNKQEIDLVARAVCDVNSK